MDTGNIFLLIGLFAVFASLFLCRYNKYILYMLICAFISVSMAVLLLFYYFTSSNFNINYVYMYSGDLPFLYRAAALWAGKEGIHLLLAWAAMLCILIFYINNKDNSGFAKRTLYVAIFIEILLLIILLMDSPFRPTPGASDAGVLSGHGLSPKFINPWLLIHPPLVVMAYAAGIILFAAAVTYLYSGEKEWAGTARSWGRISWLMLSLSMATGGVWAYEIVEWNGFWRWDSVQSGALVIWLILTAALHAIVRHQRSSKEYGTTAPLLSVSVFILSIYVMFFTRKGVRGSEHNFLGSSTWYILLAAMFLAMIIILFLTLRKKPSEPGSKITLKSLQSLRISFHATILLLCLLAFVPFWGITHSITSEEIYGDSIPIPQDAYNLWSFPIIFMLTALTGYCLLQGIIKPKGLLFVIFTVAMIGAVVSLLFRTPTLLSPVSEFYQQSTLLVRSIGSIPVISYVSVSLFMAVGTIFRFVRSKNMFSHSNMGIVLIHAGFIFIVLGATVSTSFSSVVSLNYNPAELNIPKSIDTVWGAAVTNVTTAVKSHNESEQIVDLNIYKNEKLHGSGTISLTKSDRSGYFHKLLIHRTALTDILIHFTSDAMDPSSIKLSIKVNPLINILWGGIILLISGIIILTKPKF
ncbi:cytochrome c biogenesis protein CcsA [Candidatus Methanoperedens nitratireducens]|nr:cytochrome c biogenesis protein CcsA [Candidatus Methanoperedens nitroreducens]